MPELEGTYGVIEGTMRPDGVGLDGGSSQQWLGKPGALPLGATIVLLTQQGEQ